MKSIANFGLRIANLNKAQGTGRKAKEKSSSLSNLMPCAFSLEPGGESSELQRTTEELN
jgi:hypothetical protein